MLILMMYQIRSNQKNNSGNSITSGVFEDYPMPISFGSFYKQMEQQTYAFLSVNEDQEEAGFAYEDQIPISPDECGCYAYAPSFAIDVMWQHQDKYPSAMFEEPKLRNPYRKSGLDLIFLLVLIPKLLKAWTNYLSQK